MQRDEKRQNLEYQTAGHDRRRWFERIAASFAQDVLASILTLATLIGMVALGVWASHSWWLVFSVEVAFLLMVGLVFKLLGRLKW